MSDKITIKESYLITHIKDQLELAYIEGMYDPYCISMDEFISDTISCVESFISVHGDSK